MLASSGICGGNPELIYKTMSTKWIRKTIDYISFKNDIKNINFENK